MLNRLTRNRRTQIFEPKTVTISKGSTIIWKNDDDTLHTVTSGSAETGVSGTEFDSSYIARKKTFEFKFNKVGSYDYYCTLHPYMKGKVAVTTD